MPVIDFEDATQFTGPGRVAARYSQHEFVFNSAIYARNFNDQPGTSVQAPYSLLTTNDGSAFGLFSVDADSYHFYQEYRDTYFSIIAHRMDGTQIQARFTTDSVLGFQTFVLPPEFHSGLRDVYWSKPEEYGAGIYNPGVVAYDNFVVARSFVGPAPAPDVGRGPADQPMVLDVLANDGAGALTISAASAPAGKGSVSIVEGKLVFEPGSDFARLGQGAAETIELTYTVRNAQGVTAQTTVTVTVTGVNDAPIARFDRATTNENAAITVEVLGNDSDVDDGASLTLVSVTPGAGAIVSGGTIVWTPVGFDDLALGASRLVALDYTIRDEHGAEAVATLEIVVHGSNDAPTAIADAARTGENQTITLDVRANDQDVDQGAVLTLIQVAPPVGRGTASIAGGQLMFAPGVDFDRLAVGATELVTVAYTIRDEHGATAVSAATIEIVGVNDAPVARLDRAVTTENTAVTVAVLGNDSDVDDGSQLTLVSATAAAGTVALSNGTIVWTPVGMDYLGQDDSRLVTLDYTIRDEHGAEAVATVEITVQGTNDAPTAIADASRVAENEAVTLDVRSNDVDTDQGAVLTLIQVSTPAGRGAASIADGRLVFATGADFDRLGAGAVDSVTVAYTISDEHGATAASTATIEIIGVNDAPVAAPDVQDVLEDGAVAGSVLGNDRDIDVGDRLSVSGVSFGGAAGQVGSAVAGLFGTLTLNADGGYRYAADADLLDTLTSGTGLTDVFTYQVADGKGGFAAATLTLQVTLVDDSRTTTGRNRDDVINGDAGGREYDDTINGLGGNDVLNGGGGADQLYGGDGDDQLFGGLGRDKLFGQAGNDRLEGGAGDDELTGGAGWDVMTGGAGADVFVFGLDSGIDVITDFQKGVDRLSLTGGVTATRIFLFDLDGNGALDSLVQLSGGGLITLMDTGPTTLAGFAL